MRRMYSKKQLEELISELSGDLIEVKNIKQLSDEQCNGLKVGDVVAKKTGKQYHLYLVTFKQDKSGLCLSYFDASCIETQSYDYTTGHWVYNSQDLTSFADIGGLPEVTGADNGKVLEVLTGAWGKGNKKVNVIDAPASTTLNDDEYSKFQDGVFINGDFLELKNPVFFPVNLQTSASQLIGGYIACKGNNYKIGTYKINSSKVISINSENITLDYYGNLLLNGKQYPPYPADLTNKTYVLKLVNGVLTWVEEVA